MPFLFLALLGFAALSGWLWVERRSILAKQRKLEAANHELEKRLLRAQINPHFIFNSLSAIQHFITTNDKVSALKFLSKFSTLLRQMLEQSIHVQVVLAEEIKLLQSYLDLEALRFDSCFSFVVEAGPAVDIHNTEVPILLVQPFVENAILHGLSSKKGEGRLSVRFDDASAHTVCTIRDNGVGRQAAAQKSAGRPHRPSHGMAIAEKRLALLYGNPADLVPIQINDLYDETGQAAGTEVIVHIPKLLK
jgi:LytS/YehU family sensor histidine kinase